jgi:hypothetical protein
MATARGWWAILTAAALTLPWAGCGPAVDRRDLGEILYEVPQLPENENPYDMRQLGDPPPITQRSR